MFIEKVKKHLADLNLNDESHRVIYNGLLNNPQVNILSKKYFKQKSGTFEGDFSTETEELHLYLEYEECAL